MTLETRPKIKEAKKHHGIFKLTWSSLDNCTQFIAFFYPYLTANTSKIKLCEKFSLTWSISQIPNQGKKKLIFDYELIKFLIINI